MKKHLVSSQINSFQLKLFRIPTTVLMICAFKTLVVKLKTRKNTKLVIAPTNAYFCSHLNLFDSSKAIGYRSFYKSFTCNLLFTTQCCRVSNKCQLLRVYVTCRVYAPCQPVYTRNYCFWTSIVLCMKKPSQSYLSNLFMYFFNQSDRCVEATSEFSVRIFQEVHMRSIGPDFLILA